MRVTAACTAQSQPPAEVLAQRRAQLSTASWLHRQRAQNPQLQAIRAAQHSPCRLLQQAQRTGSHSRLWPPVDQKASPPHWRWRWRRARRALLTTWTCSRPGAPLPLRRPASPAAAVTGSGTRAGHCLLHGQVQSREAAAVELQAGNRNPAMLMWRSALLPHACRSSATASMSAVPTDPEPHWFGVRCRVASFPMWLQPQAPCLRLQALGGQWRPRSARQDQVDAVLSAWTLQQQAAAPPSWLGAPEPQDSRSDCSACGRVDASGVGLRLCTRRVPPWDAR